MNDSDPSPINLDELRLLPDWLREEGPAPSKQYASHDYPTEDRPGRGRGDRPGSFGRGDRRDSRAGSGGPSTRRPDDRRSGPPRRDGGGRPFRDERGAGGPPPAPVAPAPVQVEFLPDERCLASINKQIRSTHLAYPLFGLARMFLQEPERHRVQFSLTPETVASGATLYQLGEDGPITLDRQTLEKIAFDASKEQFYVEQTVQKEPLKGNFTNVARERLSGALLGPTNYHAYQPALRALYESRYSRRMSFEDFRRNIEVSSDPALVERWKEEARTTTTINTREEPPVTLPSVAEARQHFRQHHLDGLLRTGTTLSVHGSVARKLPEPAMMNAIREAHDRELRYPAQFVQLLRQGLQNVGLQIFKHRKRVVYVSLARPTPFAAHGAVSENVTAILETIAQSPLCTRKALADRVLAKGAPPELPQAAPAPQTGAEVPPVVEPDASQPIAEVSAAAPEVTTPNPEDPLARAKAALAADLRFLVQSGHIIEFHNGTFDLPLPPKPKEEPTARKPAGGARPGGGTPVVPVEIAPTQPEEETASDTTDSDSSALEPAASSQVADNDPDEEPLPTVSDASPVDSTPSAVTEEPASVEASAERSEEKTADPLLS